MPDQKHIIQKVTLALEAGREENVRHLQKRYLDTFQKKVLPKLESFFDACDKEDYMIEIKNIDVELGDLIPDFSMDALADKMFLQVKKAIQDQLSYAGPETKIMETPLSVAKLEGIIYFLKKGILPNSYASADLTGDFRSLLNEKNIPLVEALKKAIHESGNIVLRRLVLQFPNEILVLLWQKITIHTESKRLKLFQKELLKKFQQRNNSVVREVWQQLFTLYFRRNKKDVTEKEIKRVARLLENKPATKKDKNKEAPFLNEILINDPDGMFGQNVGIILLHPFLKSFFEESQLLNTQGKFRDETAKEKAIGLLHFIGTGKTAAQEFELSFQKVICGMPIAFPISSEYDITESEKKESEKMLQAVLQYWTGLGNTSIAGLREGFFQRDGKIQQDQESIVLRVEHKTMDILLDKIPWNISMVKFPWLEKLIRVEWA